MTTQTMDVNVAMANCLIERTHFGSTEIVNICTGESSIIPWSLLNWLDAGVLLFLVLLVLLIVSAIIYEILWG